jgi:hypothetical protein
MNDMELLWNLYQDNRVQAQFHETQRVNGSGLIAGGAALMLGAMTQDSLINRGDAPLAGVMLLIGIFGFFFCVKSYERMQLHLNRCRKFLKMLDDMDELHDLTAIKDACDRETKKEFPFANKLKLRAFWQGMHVIIALAGLAILLRIYLL